MQSVSCPAPLSLEKWLALVTGCFPYPRPVPTKDIEFSGRTDIRISDCEACPGYNLVSRERERPIENVVVPERGRGPMADTAILIREFKSDIAWCPLETSGFEKRPALAA